MLRPKINSSSHGAKDNKNWYVIHLLPYAGPTSYSSTYYNPGDYQTAGGYPSSSYIH
ncbi:hypothetical protein PVK06_035675 [Gossypium arboreum]|uniref:Uncharacterized protein n=1 Tax=Gossypium arboreum TaxID=29729 RepID=A0ABR0NJK3_GOSAR|nr:hypothetical protein PVK06_035675 [Gossypium arboreum]